MCDFIEFEGNFKSFKSSVKVLNNSEISFNVIFDQFKLRIASLFVMLQYSLLKL